MAEIHSFRSASAWNERREPRSMGLGGSHLFTAIQAVLDPLALVVTLWALAYHFEDSVRPAYLILAVIVFSLTFPGTSQLRLPIHKVLFNIALRWLWLAPATQIGAHLALRAGAPLLLKLQGPPRGAVIVGMNEQGVALAGHIAGSPYSGIEMLGFFDDRGEDRRVAAGEHKLVGRIDDLPAYVKQHRVRFIYLSLPMTARPRILQVLDGLKDTTASIYFVPDMFITDLIQGRSDTVCGTTVISVCDTPFRGFNGVVKRGSDIVLALLILLLILPFLLLIAIAVKLSSPGPAIFRQRRYGLDGEQIVVYKFRSMAVVEDGKTIEQAHKNDPRVTRLGAFLRKTSLDELPQFINVLQGRMSIVGPRPHAVAHNEQYRRLIKGYMVRHKVLH